MEKYSRWRDAGTGIQPFLPPVPPRTDSNLLSTLSNVIHTIVGPIQGIVKLVLVVVTSLLYLILVPGIGLLLSPIRLLQRCWDRCFSFILLRLVLFFIGFFFIKSETVSLRRGSSRNNGNTNKEAKIKSGDIIVSNWTSYIDVLYLAYKYKPVFTQVFPVEGKNVRRISFWQALRLCTQEPALTPEDIDVHPSELYTLRELAQEAASRHWGPIAIFPEGTTSNGRALLKFAPIFKCYEPSERSNHFHILAFKYEYRNLPPTYTVGNQFWHFFKLCSQFHNTLGIRRLASDDVPCNPAMTSSQQASDLASLAGTGMDDLVGGQLLVCLANMSRMRKTNLSMSDKRDFLEYYHSRFKDSARKREQQTIKAASNKKTL
ncbi:hypothetical protein LRAMOSA01724 [Lichtheimia ramosa]|uniref:Phospholipid/glycerol acyltransferase domain-containing protein n=1 Tax=Lichtheimia ramosa TaxID=688394 RepID=A0A077WK48_9FUNG|nr:hypothetical protein LRAMOSA01724 [Lichtheimia ramosa]